MTVETIIQMTTTIQKATIMQILKDLTTTMESQLNIPTSIVSADQMILTA